MLLSLRVSAAIVATLVLVGCGGSAPSAQKRFAASANAICARSRKRIAHLSDARVARGLPIHGPEVTGKVAGLAARTADDFAALRPPADLRSDYDRFLSTMRREAKLLEQFTADYRTNNRAGLDRVGEAIAADGRSRQAAALGLTRCG
jgi:hypothetical protein